MTDFKGKTVAVVVSTFYPELAEKIFQGAFESFVSRGGEAQKFVRFDVPGSFEIPQVARQIVESNRFDAVICLGIVIRGETAHFDYVCESVARGVGEVARNAPIPVIFGVLTTDTIKQVLDRLGGSKGHKGEQATLSALQMMETLSRLTLNV